jgi:hypothetical protein
MKTKLTSIVLALQLAYPLAATALTLGEALDATNLAWKTGGSNPWRPETTWTYDGVSAAIGGYDSWLETVVSGPGTLTFVWSVESAFALEFYVDGAYQDGISANVGWQTRTFTISGSGFHTLHWMVPDYVSGGGAWLDQVAFSSSKAQQFITFAPANCLVGSAPFALPATASSRLPVTFTKISGPPLLAGNVLTPSTAGTLTISASQAGNASYAPAPPVTCKVVVVGSNLVDVLPLGMFPNFTNVAYGNGRFLAVGAPLWSEPGSPFSVFSSPDGLNWTVLEATPAANNSQWDMVTIPRRLLFTGSEFVVVGPNGWTYPWGDVPNCSSICTSMDGQTWSCRFVLDGTVTAPCGWVSSASPYTTLYDAAYGNGMLLTAARVSDLKCASHYATVVGLLRYTIPDLVFSSLRCPQDCWDTTTVGGLGFGGGNFLYIYGGNCYRSIDGTQPIDCGPFPRLTTTDTSHPVRFAYGMGNYVAVGMLTNAPRGAILISSDGTAWGPTSPSFLTAGPLTDVAFDGGKFIALGDSDLLKSDDGGRTWGAFAGGNNGRGVSFNQNVYVVTQTNGTVQACYQPAPPLVTGGTASGWVGVPFTYQIVANNSPGGYGANGLPAGLSVNRTNGLISGMPAAAGSFPVALFATNYGGIGSNLLNLTITKPTPPLILNNPVSQVVTAYQTATFTILTTGTPPLIVRWRKDGTNLSNGGRISGAASNVLSIANVQINDAGAYSVLVTNAYGTATSSNAVLTVSVGPLRFVPGSARISDGQFSFVLQSQPGLSVEIQASTNLVDWATVATLTNSNGTIPFTTPTAAFPRRFYRAHQLP